MILISFVGGNDMSEIETKRLIFRKISLSDVDNMYELNANPEVHKYIGSAPATSSTECIEVINRILNNYEKNDVGRMAVILKETGEFIGWAGFKIEVNTNGFDEFYDLGYRFKQEHWGKGYASEAAAAFVDYGINTLNLKKFYAYTHKDNLASRRVLEKVGFTFVEYFDYSDGTPLTWYEMINSSLCS